MISIFKDYLIDTSILDDFEFYEKKQNNYVNNTISLNQTNDWYLTYSKYHLDKNLFNFKINTNIYLNSPNPVQKLTMISKDPINRLENFKFEKNSDENLKIFLKRLKKINEV
jgi:hypothetical protein